MIYERQILSNQFTINQLPGTRTLNTQPYTHTEAPETGLVAGTGVVVVGTGVIIVVFGMGVAVGGAGTLISVELRVHVVPIAKALRSHKLAHALSNQGSR